MANQINNKDQMVFGNNIALVRRLFRENFRDHAVRYASALFCMAIVAITTALTAWIMKDVVESLFIEQNFDRTVSVGFFVVALFAVKGLASYGQIVLLSRVGNAIVAQLQLRLFDTILRQSGEFYIRYPSNDLITRIGQNAQAARTVIDLVVTSLGRDVLTLIGLVIVMVVQDPVLSLIALVVAPPIIFAISTLVKRVRKAAKQQFESNAKIVRVTNDTVSGIPIVKSFGMESPMRERMIAAVRSVESRMNRIASLGARTSPLMETLGGLCMGAVIIYAGWSVTNTDRTAAEFMAFITAFLLAYDPAKRIARLHINLEAGLVGARLMYEVLDAPLAITNAQQATTLKVSHGDIEFRDVLFRYPNGNEPVGEDKKPVLDRVSMNAVCGGTTALVGPSGAGKTTIANLIQRFYDPDQGLVLIDGQDISTVTLESLRDSISFVSQDTFLFDGTIRDNITAGDPSIDNGRIIEAAKVANAHSFISSLPEGYDTELAENGAPLSGGQRQRVAIARAVLKDAPIVLLDEATSALDNESEHLVREALAKLTEGKTTIVIAHRLSTIQSAAMIHVLKDGQLIESGTHEHLLERGEFYRHLYDIQFKVGEISES